MGKVLVSFDVSDEEKLDVALKAAFEHDENVRGMRTNADVAGFRSPLRAFANDMEAKLIKNDHKSSWKDLPIEALFRLLLIEIEEFKVAKEFLTVAEARSELIDCGNYAMILWDRLSTEDQKAKVGK